MPGRHRAHRLGTATVLPWFLGLVAVAATVGVVMVQNADADGCSMVDGVRLTVAADPAVAPVLRQVAADWTEREEPQVDGRCVAVEVTAVPTADAAATLAAIAGGHLDVAAPPPENVAEVPTVWVPDSSYWIARVRGISRGFFEAEPSPLASSPVVLAASPAAVEALGPGPVLPSALREPLLASLASADRPPLRFVLSEPRRDVAGLVGASWVQTALVRGDEDLPALVALFRRQGAAPPDTAALLPAFDDGLDLAPASEQAVIAHNATNPPVPVTVVPVLDAPVLDFPYAVVERHPRDQRAAAWMFLDALYRAPEVFTRHGFRAPDGLAGPGFPIGRGVTADPVPAFPVGPVEQLQQASRIWSSATSDARVLSVVNVNASMLQPMTTPQGVQVTRLQVFQAAAASGLEMFTPGTDLGHWVYAARLDGERDWIEGVPIALLDDAQKQRILTAIQSIQVAPTNEVALFETLLAAYREMQEGWDPERSNTLVIWTDSPSNKVGGLTLEETLRELERMRDVTRPVRVILLGLGPDADMAQLEALAAATGGGAFAVPEPGVIETVFLRALLALPPAPTA